MRRCVSEYGGVLQNVVVCYSALQCISDLQTKGDLRLGSSIFKKMKVSTVAEVAFHMYSYICIYEYIY